MVASDVKDGGGAFEVVIRHRDDLPVGDKGAPLARGRVVGTG
ncbi:hypothetical protein ACIOTI_18590 [Streptomyces sp. NPDC087843]